MVQKVSVNQSERIETGAVQFKYNNGYEDWPSYNIRGDNAFHLAYQIKILLDAIGDNPPPEAVLAIMELKSFKDDILENTIQGDYQGLKG